MLWYRMVSTKEIERAAKVFLDLDKTRGIKVVCELSAQAAQPISKKTWRNDSYI